MKKKHMGAPMKGKAFLVFAYFMIVFLILSFSAGCAGFSKPLSLTPVSVDVVFPNFSGLVERASPSVVAISTEGIGIDIFSDPFVEAGSGSGWIFSEDGIVITNYHVIEGADTITVELYDHKAYSADTIGADPLTDIAVLKINTGRKLRPLAIADASKIKIGDWVLIMGNPLGLGISVKEGIVSRLGVTMSSSPEQTYYNLIETSAAVNPGNSGGPMINLNGEVIGMTSLKIDAVGIEGMGYAMSSVDVIPVIRVLAEGGEINRAWLGATLVTVDNGLFVHYGLAVEAGALVAAVSKDGPADLAGIQVGDVIVAMDNLVITGADGLNREVGTCAIGQRVHLAYWREKEKKDADVVLASCPVSSIIVPGN